VVQTPRVRNPKSLTGALPKVPTSRVSARARFNGLLTMARRHGDRQPPRLTRRELQVLQLLAEGVTNAEISRRLVVSPWTTKHYVAAILEKLQVDNRTQAALRGVALGLVTVE
jgi:DNA-binding NarL/FixJ family response regulator